MHNFLDAKIIKDKQPFHGKTSKIYFYPNELFSGLEQGFEATRYHSLIVDKQSLTKEILPLAHTKDKILMALKHLNYPVYGVQFHPEAILTKCGKIILKNFIDI